jgi:diguanylate cyclase (GGDEF)-like protein
MLKRRAPGYLLVVIRPSAAVIAMKSDAAKSERKAIALRRQSAKPVRGNPDKQSAPDELKGAKSASRSAAMRLAAEVERLAAQLEQSRARIADLEVRVDIDPLTELLNRRGFERELTRSVAYVRRYGTSAALVYLDLDGFKPVNDRHGHAAGDAVLKALAAALIRQVRASDVVARIGGDEFVVLLWNVSGPAAVTKAAALERAVYATPVRWGASTLVVGASAGLALIGALDTPADVLARADAAMYARKAERNTSPRAQEAGGVTR